MLVVRVLQNETKTDNVWEKTSLVFTTRSSRKRLQHILIGLHMSDV